MMRKRSVSMFDAAPVVAGNGLIERRTLLGRGVAFAGAIGTGVCPSLTGAAAEPLSVPQWSKEPGAPFVGYGQPSKFEASVARETFNPPNEPGSGVAFTPIHLLDGMMTPNGLHYERSHSGIPEINPDARDPWVGKASAYFHAGCARALSNGVADYISGVCRQRIGPL